MVALATVQTKAGCKRLKVPDPLLRGDPRQPVLKVKKVEGSSWRPMPINEAIESPSEVSDNDSYCSDDTVVAGNTDLHVRRGQLMPQPSSF